MGLTAFDHVNIRTANLDAMIAWYGDVLDLHPGKRAPFPFPGAWLYLGDRAVVHLVGIDDDLRGGGAVTLEHVAFRAEGFQTFISNLDKHGISHTVDPVPGLTIVQVNLHDPDGNHFHIDFDSAVEEI